MVFGIVIAMVVVAAIIVGSVVVLVRTGGSGNGHDKRVSGPPIPDPGLTDHERDVALENLTVMNQQQRLRENSRMPGGM